MLREQFWKCILKMYFFERVNLKISFLREYFENVFLERAILKECNEEYIFLKYTFYNFLSFFNKIPLTFVCNSCSKKSP